MDAAPPAARVPLSRIAREWARLGITGFGGPPAHIKLLRTLCVEHSGWIDPVEFEDAIAACNLLPGPASTQLAIYCARRVCDTTAQPRQGRYAPQSSQNANRKGRRR